MQKRLPQCRNECFEFSPFRSSLVTSELAALVSLLTTNAKLQDQSWGEKVKRQAADYSVVTVGWRGRYSTHTHISVIWFWKKHKGWRARHSNQSRSCHPGQLTTPLFTSLGKRQPGPPKLGTLKYPPPGLISHQVFNSKILFGGRREALFPRDHSKFLFLNKNGNLA